MQTETIQDEYRTTNCIGQTNAFLFSKGDFGAFVTVPAIAGQLHSR